MLVVFAAGYYVIIRQAHDLATAAVVRPLAVPGHLIRTNFILGSSWAIADLVFALVLCPILVWIYRRRSALAATCIVAPTTLRYLHDSIVYWYGFSSPKEIIVSLTSWFNLLTATLPLIWLAHRRWCRGRPLE